MKSRAQNLLGSVVLLLACVGGLWAGEMPSAAAGSSEGPQDDATKKHSASQPSPMKDEFAQMDSDGDGRISAAEYASSPQSAVDRIAAGKRRGPAGITGGFDLANNEGRPDRSKFFRKMDANGDRYLSRSEVSSAAQSSGDPAKR